MNPGARWLFVGGWLMVASSTGPVIALEPPAVAPPSADESVTTSQDAVTKGETIRVETRSLPIAPENANVGALQHLSTLVLTSTDERFGGFSGLSVMEGGAITAISDRGAWWTASLEFDPSGVLSGVRDSRLGPLLDTDGTPVSGRSRRDAEELVRLPDGSWLVSFEGDHRLWRYAGSTDASTGLPPVGLPQEVTVPPELMKAGSNSGLEAMAPLPDGRLFLMTEDLEVGDGLIRGWVGRADGRSWDALGLVATGSFKPTGGVTLPNGDVLLVERSFDIVAGLRVRLSLLPREELTPGATLVPQKLARLLPKNQIDNIESIAVTTRDDGSHMIFLLSDDNFRAQQRTVLLQFVWAPE